MKTKSTKEVIQESQSSAEMEALRAENMELENRIKSYVRGHGHLEALVHQVVNAIPIAPPVPNIYKPVKRRVDHPCDVVLHLSDIHYGAIQLADEVEGFGEYSPQIAEARMNNLISDVLDWVSIKRTGYAIPRLHILMTGDYVCFPEDAHVTMADGTVKQIKDVRVGDDVLSDPEIRKVTAVHPRQAKEGETLVRIKITGGLDIVATKEHVVRCLPREVVETGWNSGGKRGVPFVIRNKDACLTDITERALGELRPRDYLVIRPFRPTDGQESLSISDITGIHLTRGENGVLFKKVRGTSPAVTSTDRVEMDNDLLWLLGIYLAEGSSSVGRSGCINTAVFTLNHKEDDLAAEIVRIVKEKFGYSPKINKIPQKGTQTVMVLNQIIATFLVNLCGGKGKVEQKKIDDAIYHAPRSLLPLVAGWIDGDGGYSERKQALTGVTVNPSLSRQMSTIMWSEHIPHTVKLDTWGRNRPAYRMSLTGESAQTLASYCVRYNMVDFTPTYQCGLWVDDCYCLPIQSIHEEQATGTLYDLSVDKDHIYQVGGYLVHNSGDIHEELRVTNAFPVPVQAVGVAEMLSRAILGLIPHFAEIIIHMTTDDNHGRLTKKPQAKEGGLNNWGYVVGSYMKAQLRNQKTVKCNIIPRPWESVECNGRRYLLTHGHRVSGWAGFPYYGIERLVAREAIKRMNAADIRKFHKVVMGHWHAPLAHQWYWIGGSMSGTDAFDHGQGRHALPMQVSWMVHPQHGEFDRTEWYLRA